MYQGIRRDRVRIVLVMQSEDISGLAQMKSGPAEHRTASRKGLLTKGTRSAKPAQFHYAAPERAHIGIITDGVGCRSLTRNRLP